MHCHKIVNDQVNFIAGLYAENHEQKTHEFRDNGLSATSITNLLSPGNYNFFICEVYYQIIIIIFAYERYSQQLATRV